LLDAGASSVGSLVGSAGSKFGGRLFSEASEKLGKTVNPKVVLQLAKKVLSKEQLVYHLSNCGVKNLDALTPGAALNPGQQATTDLVDCLSIGLLEDPDFVTKAFDVPPDAAAEMVEKTKEIARPLEKATLIHSPSWDSTQCQTTTGFSTSVCSTSCPGGFQVKDLCPGPSGVKCCVSKKQDVQLPGAYPSGDDQCAAQGGRCIDSKNPSNNEANAVCGGRFKSRLCAGPDERRCCIGDYLNYPPESSMVEVRLRR
jgi:hypothetical protein